MRVSSLPPPPAISLDAATEYLRALGNPGVVVRVTPCAGGLSNHNYRIDLADRSTLLLRLYRWWIADPEPPRGAKEMWLHGLLRDAGVRVPTVMASSDRAALLEWIDGDKLRDVALAESVSALAPAWRSVGENLALAHRANPLGSAMGEIVGRDVVAFEPSWPIWLGHEIEKHAGQLLVLEAIDDATLRQIQTIARERLPKLLADCDIALLHNDAHPANVLVRHQAEHWDLAAWIDWEFAWVGDADWDLTRFDFIGTAQVGQIPETFWRGYGRKPDPVRRAVYELFFIVWLAGTRIPISEAMEPRHASSQPVDIRPARDTCLI